MTTYLTPEQIETYKKLSSITRAITDAIYAFDVAVLNADIPESVKLKCLDITNSGSLKGLSYRLSPQTEWVGGDQFKTRSPHIANE